MKDFLKQLYKYLYNEELIQCPVPPTPPKTNRDKLIEASQEFFGIDPTPKDEQPDDVACVHSLATIIRKVFPDFPILTYTPVLLDKIRLDGRFDETSEFTEGNVIISVTNTGNGKLLGHCGILGRNGRIYSNSSETGLWLDKYTNSSWIERYSRKGQLELHIFEIL